ncbi:MAG: hypothetical protein JWM11_2917 [Planctomycetaceae bacterium]|nr:hypothetical protein [Planctomycetaceae bacterium]
MIWKNVLILAFVAANTVMMYGDRADKEPPKKEPSKPAVAVKKPVDRTVADVTTVPTRRVVIQGTCNDRNSKRIANSSVTVFWSPGKSEPLELTETAMIYDDCKFLFRTIFTEMPRRRDLVVVATAPNYAPQKFVLDQDQAEEIKLSIVLEPAPGEFKNFDEPALQLGKYVVLPPPGRRPGRRYRVETPANRLLDQLYALNRNKNLFQALDLYQDRWLRTLKDLVDLGSTAIPELIAELDDTQDSTMLRSLGFVLRAIGDKRAVPALIRAIPKTLMPYYPQVEFSARNPELLKFGQRHQVYPDIKKDIYFLTQAPREIFHALYHLTGKKLNDDQILTLYAEEFSARQYAKKKIFQHAAEQWAEWWEKHWSEFVTDQSYSQVNLAAVTRPITPWELTPGTRFKVVGTGSNYLLESVFDWNAKNVLYDFDTGRLGSLPEKWLPIKAPAEDHAAFRKRIEANLPEIVKWAAAAGYDMLGTEFISPLNGKRHYALYSIDMQIWQLRFDKTPVAFPEFTLEELQASATRRDTWLLPVDPKTKAIHPTGVAMFLYITREKTPGFVRVGVETQKTNAIVNGLLGANANRPFGQDDELNPSHDSNGRRFGWTSLMKAYPKLGN